MTNHYIVIIAGDVLPKLVLLTVSRWWHIYLFLCLKLEGKQIHLFIAVAHNDKILYG